jgi:hypothetical protein
MLKIIVKLLMPIALVLAALFGYTIGIGAPSYLLLFFTILVFFIDMAIAFVMDKVTDINFYKNTGVSVWQLLRKTTNNN